MHFIQKGKLADEVCMLSVLHTSPRILDHLTEFRKFCMKFMNRGLEKTTQ